MPPSDGAETWHIVTGEYPPGVGGVADYSRTVAQALAEAGDRVHVWTAGADGTTTGTVTVHRVFGAFRRQDSAVAGALMDRQPRGRVLVQWVPHAFGRHGTNLPFAMWLRGRSISRADPVDVMVHEPFMPLAGTVRGVAAAAVQRLMTRIVLNTASRAFAGTPAWIRLCRDLTQASFRWSPVPSGVPVVATEQSVSRWRSGQDLAQGERLVGSFGRAGRFQETTIERLADSLKQRGIAARILLIGIGSHETAARLSARRPELAWTVRATGPLDRDALSSALRGCDVLLQAYEDGVCTRHSAVSALLAHGCPIVTNAGRFTEQPLWTRDGAVALVGSADANALVVGVLRLLDDGRERRRLSAAALRLYASTFDVRHTVASLKG